MIGIQMGSESEGPNKSYPPEVIALVRAAKDMVRIARKRGFCDHDEDATYDCETRALEKSLLAFAGIGEEP